MSRSGRASAGSSKNDMLSAGGMNCDHSKSASETRSVDMSVNGTPEFELQCWNVMWTHLVSMITQVVDYPNVFPQTGDEKRAVLVDLVVKLCEAASDPKEDDEYERLREKYTKCKQELKKLKEIDGDVTQADEQIHMVAEIKQLKSLVRQQIERQEEFFAKSSPKLDESRESLRRAGEYSESSPEEHSRRVRQKVSKKKVRCKDTRGETQLGELIEMTNQLRDDYRRLGNFHVYDGSVSEVSLDHLSRLNESLMADEKFDSSSD